MGGDLSHVPPLHWQHDWDSEYDPYPEWETYPIEPQVEVTEPGCIDETIVSSRPRISVGFHQGWRGVPRDNA